MSGVKNMSPFLKLGIPENPVILAPLAGVSDHPFRRVCVKAGADLTYVEMLSATAINFNSERTFQMMRRHPSEQILGVQLTGGDAESTARAIEVLDKRPEAFETIDINMGCPVTKVVKAGCGSAILKDPQRVYDTVKRAVTATSKPLSVKIRVGWDQQTRTFLEVADAAQSAGAAWLTIHGRLRNDDYATPVDLDAIARLKQRLSIPVIGNGNVFGKSDADVMRGRTLVDGVMVSRGALGNPWVFREIKSGDATVTLDEWETTVLEHLDTQAEQYGEAGYGAVVMRKHLLWYLKGWAGARKMREKLATTESLRTARAELVAFAAELRAEGVTTRMEAPENTDNRFLWDPKYEMDRRLDRGVGDDQMASL
jgi:tRNA-dihydrouridine synthase B